MSRLYELCHRLKLQIILCDLFEDDLSDKGCLVGNTHGQWSSQLKDTLIGEYVRVITHPHEIIIVVCVKDCGYIKMTELIDVDLTDEGLSRNLTSNQN